MGKLAQQLGGQSQVKVAPGKGKGCDCQKTKAPTKMKCGGKVKEKK